MDFNCLINNFSTNGDTYRQYANHLTMYMEGTISGYRWYFGKDGSWSAQEPKNNKLVVVNLGTWECDGDNNFKIIDKTNKRKYSSKSNNFEPIDNNQPTPTTEIDPVFSCIKAHYDNEGRKLTPQKGGYATVTTKDGEDVWVFSKAGKWSQYNKSSKTTDFTGKWECTGTASFSIISDDGEQWISSDKFGWVDIAEPTTKPTTEPTTGPTTGGGGFQWKDTDITIDQLKSGKTVSMGMRGEVIGEIQKLLIDKGYKDVSKSGESDNKFGRMTKAQVVKFQSENKDDKGEQLKPDGIVGQKTINALLTPKTAPNTRGAQTAVQNYFDKRFSK